VGTVTDRLVRYAVLLAFEAPPADLLIRQSATAQVVINRAAGVLYLPSRRCSGPASGSSTAPWRAGGPAR
jgi:hypothetical protein